MLDRLVKLDTLPDEVAWELVTPLFNQRAAIVLAGAVYVAFGLFGALASGGKPYLAGAAYAFVITVWRIHQARAFASRPPTDRPVDWAVRGLRSAWAAALGWGFWSLLATVEPEPRLAAILFGIQAALVTAAAVINSSVPVVAEGQVILASVPMCIGCLVAGNMFSSFYAVMVLIEMAAGLGLIRNLHQNKLRTLSNEMKAAELSAKLAAANEELELVNQHLKQQVATDSLTGLLNRRAFDLAAAREWRAAMRERRLLTVMMIDVDLFKAYNDHYGHQAGDTCLRHIATELGAVLQRPGDILARYGGEEFVAILPLTDEEGAMTVADRVLERLGDRALPHALSPLGRISVSIGICVAIVTPSRSLALLIEAADQALYDAKRAGRNRAAMRQVEQVEASAFEPPGGEEGRDERMQLTPSQPVSS